MGKWDSQTLLGGSGVGVADLMLISDQSQAEGSQDRNITVGEASLAGHQFLVSQTSHGLSVGDCVRWNGSAYVEAVATTGANSVFNGVIVQVIDTDSYVIKHDGFAYGFSSLTPGSTYYLQDSGGLGLTAGTVSVPVLLAVTSTSGWLLSNAGSGGVSYEEGSWTPEFSCSVSGTFTYTTQQGEYKRIGNMVVASFLLSNATITSLSGDVTVIGLPFTSAAGSGYSEGMFIGRAENWTPAAAYFRGRVTPSTSFIKLTDNSTSSATSSIVAGDIKNNSVLGGTVIYTT